MRADEATPFDVAQDRPFDRLRTDSAQVGLPLEALLEAFRVLSQCDPAVANVLKQFNLL